MEYPKINGLYKRWRKDLHKELPKGVKYGDFKIGQFSDKETEYLLGNQWVFTEKLDGTNIRIYLDKDSMRICGRTDKAEVPKPLTAWINGWYATNMGYIKETLGDRAVILYGEGIGAKIQKGGENFGEQHFKLFDISIGGYWLKREDVDSIAEAIHLDSVPSWTGTIQEAIDKVKEKPKSHFGDFILEGYVGVPKLGLISRKGERIITKIKVVDFK